MRANRRTRNSPKTSPRCNLQNHRAQLGNSTPCPIHSPSFGEWVGKHKPTVERLKSTCGRQQPYVDGPVPGAPDLDSETWEASNSDEPRTHQAPLSANDLRRAARSARRLPPPLPPICCIASSPAPRRPRSSACSWPVPCSGRSPSPAPVGESAKTPKSD